MHHVCSVCVVCVLCVMCSGGGGCCVHVMCVLCVLRVCACDVCGLSCVSERQRCAQLSESCCAYGPRPAYCTP